MGSSHWNLKAEARSDRTRASPDHYRQGTCRALYGKMTIPRQSGTTGVGPSGACPCKAPANGRLEKGASAHCMTMWLSIWFACRPSMPRTMSLMPLSSSMP